VQRPFSRAHSQGKALENTKSRAGVKHNEAARTGKINLSEITKRNRGDEEKKDYDRSGRILKC